MDFANGRSLFVKLENRGGILMQKQAFTVINPLAQHFLTKLRDRETPDALNGGEQGARHYQELGRQLSRVLVGEMFRVSGVGAPQVSEHGWDRMLPIKSKMITTAMEEPCDGVEIDETKLLGVHIKRAGKIIHDAFSDFFPESEQGILDMSRSHKPPFDPIEGGHMLPADLSGFYAVLMDCMIASGGSARRGISRLKDRGVTNVVMLGWVACQPGIDNIHEEHPEVPIIVAAVDPVLDRNAYIHPGLKDAGDRLYGLKHPEAAAPSDTNGR